MAVNRVMMTGGGMLVATVPVLSWKVHAAENSTERKQIKINELPIYSSPVTQSKYEFIEEEVGSFRAGISEVRQSVWNYLDSIRDTTDNIKQKYEVSKAHTKDLITYIQDDPAILPRAGVIALAGLGGIIAGYKGGIFRKVILSSSAIVGAAALCYPKEAVAITTDIYDMSYNAVKPLWEDTVGKSEDSSKEMKNIDTEKKSDKVEFVQDKKTKKPVDKALMDMGQSKEEDKDMYSTRGS